jgi:hypothetical protein
VTRRGPLVYGVGFKETIYLNPTCDPDDTTNRDLAPRPSTCISPEKEINPCPLLVPPPSPLSDATTEEIVSDDPSRLA